MADKCRSIRKKRVLLSFFPTSFFLLSRLAIGHLTNCSMKSSSRLVRIFLYLLYCEREEGRKEEGTTEKRDVASITREI